MSDLPEHLRDPMKVLERGRQIEESGGLRLEQRPSNSLCDRLRFTWADNGAGYNSDFTADLNAAADEIERLQRLMVEARPFVDICAGGGVGNTDKVFEAEAQRIVERIDDESVTDPEPGDALQSVQTMFRAAVSSLAEISQALDIPDHVASVANGNAEILKAIAHLKRASSPPPVVQDMEKIAWCQKVHEDLASYTDDGGGLMIHVRAKRALGIMFEEMQKLEKALYPSLTKEACPPSKPLKYPPHPECAKCERFTDQCICPPDGKPACQHDLLKPATTIDVIDDWSARCTVCFQDYRLGRPVTAGETSGDRNA